ncbi:MAG TPA: hypothetical protein VGW39_12185 [Chthoniobacterales bacterium]|nr:hypothetical protein [Chthoniobacterales bacterium]
MQLKFPPLSGGTVSGLNDAGIETFEGDFARNVVRECAQNSLDAASTPDQAVTVRIDRVSLQKIDVPFMPALEKILRACRDHWSQHDKAKKFFTTALTLAGRQHIDALRISDFGTTGVDGSDEQNTGRWFGLVKSRGVSNQKGAESGGAFGIGKDAPLAGSALRTVLYSTRTLDGQVALQGVCRLVTHAEENGHLTQGTGFIGAFDAENLVYRAIRDVTAIPKQFLRTEPGLDVWILGSRHLDDDWAQPFLRSALANFWPAIANGTITFIIGDNRIDGASLGAAMRAERFDEHVAEAWPFYQALVDQHAKTFNRKLPHAGECRLHLLLARRDLPKRVCMVRRTGMVIDTYQPRVGFLPFAGLFVCEGHEGNRLLRSLEPPRHDKWDPERGDEPRAVAALKEIKEWIRDELKKQTPHASDDQFNESEVPPDLLEDIPENPITDSSAETEPDLGGNPKEAAPPQKVKIRTRTMRKTADPGKKGTKGGDDDVDDPKKGDGKSTGGRKGREGEDEGESSIAPRIPYLRARAFNPSDSDDAIELVLRADANYDGSVWIEGLGDDGSAENLPLESAEIIGVGPVEVEQSKIKNLKLAAEETVRVRLRARRPGKYAIRATLS